MVRWFPSRPLPSPPATSPSTSPTPAYTPGPVATSKAALRTAALSPLASGPSYPASVEATAGRSKAQRWGNDSPPSGKSGSASPSFMEVLVSGVRPAAASQTSAAPTPTASVATGLKAARVAPRIILREDRRGRKTVLPAVVADGWTTMEGRHARQERRRLEQRSRQQVPADLRGRCFNCFSRGHRAASCASLPRCFRCRSLGHRSAGCPRPVVVSRREASRPRRVEWRPKALAGAVAVPATADIACDALETSQNRKRRRCRARKEVWMVVRRSALRMRVAQPVWFPVMMIARTSSPPSLSLAGFWTDRPPSRRGRTT